MQPFIILILGLLVLSLLAGGGLGIAQDLQDPVRLVALAVAFGLAITFHEFMHAYVANALGDATGRLLGRMSLNPLVHLDPLGTLFLVLFRFGWGKPVPVNYSRLQGGRRGGMAVAFAGPATNFVIAAVFAVPFRMGVAGALGHNYELILSYVVYFNVLLGIFNLIPIPPLDGSKVLYGVVPPRLAWNWAQFETVGPFLLLLVLFYGPTQSLLGTAVFQGTRLLGGDALLRALVGA